MYWMNSACIGSIIRVVAFDQLDFKDITFTLVTASIWTSVEQSLGIICASLPLTRPLFSRFFSNIRGGTNRNYSGLGPSDAVPIPDCESKRNVIASLDISPRTSPAHPDPENTIGTNLVMADADEVLGDDLLAVPSRTWRSQGRSQEIDRPWSV